MKHLVVGICSIVAVVQLADNIAHAAIPVGRVEVETYSNSSTGLTLQIRIEGAIAPPMAEQVMEAFKTHRDTGRVVIDLNSPGGIVEEGRKIIQLLESEAQSKRSIETQVLNGSQCGSMCVPIFMSAPVRKAGHAAVFMFHPITPFGVKVNHQLTEKYLMLMIEKGLSGDWVAAKKQQGVFASPGEYWMSGKEMVDEKTGAITELLSRYLKFNLDDLPIDPNLHAR